jgi:hypothetical protein
MSFRCLPHQHLSVNSRLLQKTVGIVDRCPISTEMVEMQDFPAHLSLGFGNRDRQEVSNYG